MWFKTSLLDNAESYALNDFNIFNVNKSFVFIIEYIR